MNLEACDPRAEDSYFLLHRENSWTVGFSEAAEQMWQAGGQMSGVVKERDILNVSEFKMSMELYSSKSIDSYRYVLSA